MNPETRYPKAIFVSARLEDNPAMDKRSYIEILKSKGLVRILGTRWDRLTAVLEGHEVFRQFRALERQLEGTQRDLRESEAADHRRVRPTSAGV